MAILNTLTCDLHGDKIEFAKHSFFISRVSGGQGRPVKARIDVCDEHLNALAPILDALTKVEEAHAEERIESGENGATRRGTERNGAHGVAHEGNGASPGVAVTPTKYQRPRHHPRQAKAVETWAEALPSETELKVVEVLRKMKQPLVVDEIRAAAKIEKGSETTVRHAVNGLIERGVVEVATERGFGGSHGGIPATYQLVDGATLEIDPLIMELAYFTRPGDGTRARVAAKAVATPVETLRAVKAHNGENGGHMRRTIGVGMWCSHSDRLKDRGFIRVEGVKMAARWFITPKGERLLAAVDKLIEKGNQ